MAMRGDIPFFRALRYIPREMRDKLPPEYIARLEPRVRHIHPISWTYLLSAKQKLVSPEQVHREVREMIHLYRRKYRMVFPALNWPPILLQYLKRLALPGMAVSMN